MKKEMEPLEGLSATREEDNFLNAIWQMTFGQQTPQLNQYRCSQELSLAIFVSHNSPPSIIITHNGPSQEKEMRIQEGGATIRADEVVNYTPISSAWVLFFFLSKIEDFDN